MEGYKGFKIGDHVEVWSASQGAWLKGEVDSILTANEQIDGYPMKQGSIHVSYGTPASTKWITPEQISKILRIDPSASAAVGFCRERSVSGAVTNMCIFGCGRPVQVGLTRNLKAYDTCCKKCATTKGKGGHDEHCGMPVSSPSHSAVAPLKDARTWLTGVLASRENTLRFADGVFDNAASDKNGFLKPDELTTAWRAMTAELGLDVDAELVPKWAERYCDPTKVNKEQFQLICEKVLKHQMTVRFPETLPTHASMFVRKNPRPYTDVYTVGPLLGQGSFGQVYGVTHKISGQERVCKKIQYDERSSGMSLEEIMAEIQNMAMLDHPNLIKVYEYFQDHREVVQILEPCSGGELQDYIDKVFRKGGPAYDEAFVCDVMKQTLRALAFMHNERYLHKDLKPQNIMFVDKDSSSIKVIDFGLAELFPKGADCAKEAGGTLLYMAPEVFEAKISFQADIWSTGVILYNLLTGTFPFMGQWPPPAGKDQEWWERETQKLITSSVDYKQPTQRVQHGDNCKDFLRKMLTRDPRIRPSAEECLRHPWFQEFSTEPPPLSIGVTQCLEGYASQLAIKQAIFLLIAQQATVPAVAELRGIFTHFDVKNKGMLETATMEQVLSRTQMSAVTVQSIVHALDKDNSGTISWTEFLAAAMCIKACRDPQLVRMVFDMLDSNRDAKITELDFLEVFAKESTKMAGSALTKETWRRLLPEQVKKMAQSIGQDPGKTEFNKDEFEKFVGLPIIHTVGDALRAVAS